MFKIYYFENYGTKDIVSADGLDFTKNINDALNYIVKIKKENYKTWIRCKNGGRLQKASTWKHCAAAYWTS